VLPSSGFAIWEPRTPLHRLPSENQDAIALRVGVRF